VLAKINWPGSMRLPSGHYETSQAAFGPRTGDREGRRNLPSQTVACLSERDNWLWEHSKGTWLTLLLPIHR
jgi:hypothetical protein